jgi:hypothetical protein
VDSAEHAAALEVTVRAHWWRILKHVVAVQAKLCAEELLQALAGLKAGEEMWIQQFAGDSGFSVKLIRQTLDSLGLKDLLIKKGSMICNRDPDRVASLLAVPETGAVAAEAVQSGGQEMDDDMDTKHGADVVCVLSCPHAVPFCVDLLFVAVSESG